MKNVAFIAVLVLSAAALAGCTSPSSNPPPSNQTSGTATGVTVSSSPATSAPNSQALVCWHVAGSGTIMHTALHWDTTSHAGPSATFSDYKGGTVYPDNQTQAASSGYALPGDFCANLPVGTQDVYFRAHAMSGPAPPGIVSDEKEIRVPGSSMPGNMTMNGVALQTDFTGGAFDNGTWAWNASAGSNVTVCWWVKGTGTIPHTAVHWGPTSHASDPTASFQSYPAGAIYPNNETAQNASGYELSPTGSTFCANVPAPPTSGVTWYYRSHAMMATGPPGILSQHELSITAK